MSESPSVEQLAARLQAGFERHLPDYTGMIGTSTLGVFRFNATTLVRVLVGEIWKRQNNFAQNDSTIAAVIDELDAFIRRDTVTIAFIAPLINFRIDSDVSETALLPEVTLRRLSEAEITEFHGGPAERLMFQPHTAVLQEFAMVGTFEEPKLLVDFTHSAESSFQRIRNSLDRIVLGLRTFKSGVVGYTEVHVKCIDFVPFPIGWVIRTFTHEYIPMGVYQILHSEQRELIDHIQRFADEMDASFETGCSRLSTAGIRTDMRDRIIDAVIGLEAILLADTGDQKYRGELRYRFAINYSTLFPWDERHKAFRHAREAYDLRSTLAHGGRLNPTVKWDGESISAHEAANRTVEMLRLVVKRFLPDAESPPYRKVGYWDNGYFSASG